jgi:hypothetical protein
MGDTGRPTNEDGFVNVGLGAVEDLLDGLRSALEEVPAAFLETGMSEGSVEVDAFNERADFDKCLCSRGEGLLDTTFYFNIMAKVRCLEL